jgi:predicted NBD/HSP70 family sugar kinase
MEQYAGIDVSLESASVCVVDANGKVIREAKVASEPEPLIAGSNRSASRSPAWVRRPVLCRSGFKRR